MDYHYIDCLPDTDTALCGIVPEPGIHMAPYDDVLDGYPDGICPPCWMVGYAIMRMSDTYRDYISFRTMILYAREDDDATRARARMWAIDRAMRAEIEPPESDFDDLEPYHLGSSFIRATLEARNG